jgi:hypothetical protein
LVAIYVLLLAIYVVFFLVGLNFVSSINKHFSRSLHTHTYHIDSID